MSRCLECIVVVSVVIGFDVLCVSSRLGCQVVVTPGMNGMVIKLPGDTLNMLK